jgi:hypothetical protein
MIHSLGEENFSGAAALRLERDMRTGEWARDEMVW